MGSGPRSRESVSHRGTGITPHKQGIMARRSQALTLDQTRTQAAYGLQWNRFRIIRTEEDRVTFCNRTQLAPEELDGKVVLDAGCGMGRYLRISGESSARLIVGVDLSRAVEAARDLTRDVPRVSVVRGDLLRLPFAAGTFDHIYSLGVIDHTPDPRAAFLCSPGS